MIKDMLQNHLAFKLSFFSTPSPDLTLPFINGNLHRGLDCVCMQIFVLYFIYFTIGTFFLALLSRFFWQNLGILV